MINVIDDIISLTTDVSHCIQRYLSSDPCALNTPGGICIEKEKGNELYTYGIALYCAETSRKKQKPTGARR